MQIDLLLNKYPEILQYIPLLLLTKCNIMNDLLSDAQSSRYFLIAFSPLNCIPVLIFIQCPQL